MADDQPIGADDVARRQFNTAFRGFDQHEVRAFLAQIAAELASLHERERGLRERLAAVEDRPAAREVSGDDLEDALGTEMARVLHAAREAAAEIRGRAEESVARLLREANDDAARVHAEAEEAAKATLEEAQRQGKEMLAEAQAVRERILKDLNRRRKAAAGELEQLVAGRARLLAAYEVVRTTLDQATGELTGVEADAGLVADAARLRAPADEGPVAARRPEPEPEQPAGTEGNEGTGTPVHDVVPPIDTAEVPVVSVVLPLPGEEPPPPPPTLPTPADDRRSSSLRLLRRKADPEPPPLLEDVEGVRIIRPGDEEAAPPVPRAVPDLPMVEAGAGPDPTPVPEPPVVAEVAPEPDPEAEPDEKPVDDLFARLRADRAAAVTKAEQVLSRPGPASEPEPVAAAAAEPEPAVVADAVFEARDAAVEPVEKALTRSLKRALADEQNEVLDALRRFRGTPTLATLLPAADEHAARFAAASADHLRSAAEAGAGDAGGPATDDLAANLGAEVAVDLRARLERALDAAGGDDEMLTEAISATYREWKSSRSEAVARHHVAAAYAAGSFAATDADVLRWVVDVAEGRCPDCDDNALAGPTPKGNAFPTGQVHPPAHAGCRCLVLPAS